jgi:hypothetical protein
MPCSCAPDLLEAVEALIYRYDNPDRKPYPALRTFGSLMEDLRTAVAKAKWMDSQESAEFDMITKTVYPKG